jgi:hypothetical protein
MLYDPRQMARVLRSPVGDNPMMGSVQGKITEPSQSQMLAPTPQSPDWMAGGRGTQQKDQLLESMYRSMIPTANNQIVPDYSHEEIMQRVFGMAPSY